MERKEGIPEETLIFRFSIFLGGFFKSKIEEFEPHLEQEIKERFILSAIYSLGFINGDTQLLQNVGLGDLKTLLAGEIKKDTLKEILSRPIIKAITSWLEYAIKEYQKDKDPKWLYPKDPIELLKTETYRNLNKVNLN